jgi:hypothetical protein
MRPLAAPFSPAASSNARATPTRLAKLAVIKVRSAARLEWSSVVASLAVAALSMRATLSQTQARNTTTDAIHPVSVATCQGVRRIAIAKARAPAANATTTSARAEKTELSDPLLSLLASLLANR